MEFERVVGNKKDYLPLLLLADEQEDMIDRYLGKGEMYLAKDPEVVGECGERNGWLREDRGCFKALRSCHWIRRDACRCLQGIGRLLPFRVREKSR